MVAAIETKNEGKRYPKTILHYNRDKVKIHPTQKPVTLGANAMMNSSRPNQIVLDLFTGSGSSIIAAEQTGRICYAMELDPKFCDVIRKRYFRFINKLNYDEDDTGWEDFTPKVEANHDGEKD
jgi:DNA modification methylase